MGVEVSEKLCWVRRAGDKTELGQETRLGEARDSFEDITKDKRFAVGLTEEREKAKFGKGAHRDIWSK
jgi:hypothetical protein